MPDGAMGLQAMDNIALTWWRAKVSVVPIRANGSKRPTRDWSALQHIPMTLDEVNWYWRPGEKVGVAAICGRVSGGLEMCELEAAATDSDSLSKIHNECRLRGVENLWDSLQHEGYAEWTPSGGIHILYRIIDHDVPGNTKIASARDGKTLAETRGEGGYVIVAPTNGACHPSGQSWVTVAGKQGVIPNITWAQRMAIHNAIASALDESPPPPPTTPRREIIVRTAAELRPGDDWESKHDWDEPWFTDQEWRISHRNGGETFWTRPGKDLRDGHSASTGYAGDKDRLYVWSTSTGLPTEQPLTKFFVYAHYHWGGDMMLAARALRYQGYGKETDLVSPQLRALESGLGSGFRELEVSSPPHEGLDLTDTGSGRRMKDMFGDSFRFDTRENSWYEWTGVAWRKDESLAIERAAEAVAEATIAAARNLMNEADSAEELKAATKIHNNAIQLKNQSKIKAAIARFAAQPGMTMTPDQVNMNTHLLNLPNGTLDLESLELRPHDPADIITLTMNAEYDKDAECPLFEKFMEDAIPDLSVREYVQRALGYTLLGSPTEHAIFMLHGPSGTGKSVLTNLMTMVFGGYGATAPASTFRVKKQSDSTVDLHKLRGARFVASSELPEGQQLDDELVKRLTGGDMITSRGLYQDFTEWKPKCVIWLATNFLPKVSSDDNAMWRRAKSITMDTQFGVDGRPAIPGYANILFLERNGILNWLLEGLSAYRMRGLDQPDAVTRDVESYRTDVDIVASFIRDLVEEGILIQESEAEIKSNSLRALFDTYCTEQHQTALGGRRYANRLKALGYSYMKVGGAAMWKGLRQDVQTQYGIVGLMGR